jgi:hypothetical protein
MRILISLLSSIGLDLTAIVMMALAWGFILAGSPVGGGLGGMLGATVMLLLILKHRWSVGRWWWSYGE